MAYFTLTELKALVPDGWVTDALDDDANGSGEQFAEVLAVAEKEVNGILGLRYDVPLSPVPDAVSTIALYIAAEIVYGRRGMADRYPYKDATGIHRRTLRDIGAGTLPLSPTKDRKDASISIISEASKTHSSNINL